MRWFVLLLLVAIPAEAQTLQRGDSVMVVGTTTLFPEARTIEGGTPIPMWTMLYVDQASAGGEFGRTRFQGRTGWVGVYWVTICYRNGQMVRNPREVRSILTGSQSAVVPPAPSIEVYPNPAPGRVRIDGAGTIYDATGRAVRRASDEYVSLPSGPYFIRSEATTRYFVVL